MSDVTGARETPLGDGRFAIARERPTSTDALRDVVERRVSQGLALYPQGGCTALDYGGPPSRPGAAIDMTALDRVIDYPSADMTITVEAGMTLSALQQVLSANGQRLPLDPPHAARATMGGIYATNASGPRRYGAGRPRDLIIGVGFVNSRAQLIKGGGRVVKNVAGYDFPKLMTGAMGTLGILTQMTFKVRPAPEAAAVVWVACPDLDDASTLLNRLNVSCTRPIAVELLNRTALRTVAARGGAAPDAAWGVALGYEDNRASVAWQVDAVARELGGARATVVRDQESAASWSALAQSPSGDDARLAIRANLRPSGLAKLLAMLDPDRWRVQAHAGSGIVHAARVEADSGVSLSLLATEIGALRAVANSAGGNLVLPRCPTDWKEPLRVWGSPPGDWPVMCRLQKALDPPNAMNPGRFVDTI